VPTPFVERVALRLIARGFVTAVAILVAIPAYLTLAPSWRPLAARMACAALVAFGCLRMIRSVRGAADPPPRSALDAPRAKVPAPELDERFLRLRDELVFSTRSRHYFDSIFRPQLAKLAGVDVPPPPLRRGLRRLGPSLAALAGLIATVEKRA
jgi:hypothetical protein